MMSDKTRFKIVLPVVILILISWLALAVVMIFVAIMGIHSYSKNDSAGVLLALFGGAVAFVYCYLTGTLGGNLWTNNIKGYRPWEWGMAAKTREGKAAQEVGLGLSYAQVHQHFQ